MLLVRQQIAGRRKEYRPVNYMAALMVANHEAFLWDRNDRIEQLVELGPVYRTGTGDEP